MPAFRDGPRGGRIARALDLDMEPRFAARAPVRRAIEVYPHPAIVVLFGLDETLKYKARRGRTLDDRREAFRALAAGLEGFGEGTPALDVAASPRWSALRAGIETTPSGVGLDRLEDELDAYVCAYVAAYYWTHGTERCHVVGDLASGYIVTPVTDAIASCLDSTVL